MKVLCDERHVPHPSPPVAQKLFQALCEAGSPAEAEEILLSRLASGIGRVVMARAQ